MNIQVGDTLRLKKQHPCGSRDWEVLRIGADFRLKCRGCGHQIMMARRAAEKSVKAICRSGSDTFQKISRENACTDGKAVL